MKRTYGQILLDHYKKYPNHLTYRMISSDRKVYWIATPSNDNRTHYQFKTLQALERYLDRTYKYTIEYTKELTNV